MIIKCRYCKKEFDKPSHRNQHERDAHAPVQSTSLVEHLRQYRHNDNSGFVFAYELRGVDRLVAYLQAKAAPKFENAEDLIAWLDTLHTQNGDAITNQKWEPAQLAIAALRPAANAAPVQSASPADQIAQSEQWECAQMDAFNVWMLTVGKHIEQYSAMCGWMQSARRNAALVQSASPVAQQEGARPISEQNARFAIDGAIAYGKMGINKPPSDDHWLMPYWEIGRTLTVPSPALPEGWKKALHAAVAAIYFDDSSDFKSALGAVVRHLDERLAGELLGYPKAAYDKVCAMIAATPDQADRGEQKGGAA